MVQFHAGSPEKLCTALPGRRRMLAERVVEEIVPAVDADPHGVVVIELRDTPFSFESLPPSDQAWPPAVRVMSTPMRPRMLMVSWAGLKRSPARTPGIRGATAMAPPLPNQIS